MEQYISLYHAFCEFSYAIGNTDLPFNAEDRTKMRKLLEGEFNNHQEMINHILKKDCMDINIAYMWVIQDMAKNKTDLVDENKARFARVVSNVLISFPGMTKKGISFAKHFLTELS